MRPFRSDIHQKDPFPAQVRVRARVRVRVRLTLTPTLTLALSALVHGATVAAEERAVGQE